MSAAVVLQVGLCAASALAGVTLLRPRSAERRARAGNAWARQHQAYVSPALVPALDAWLDRARRRAGVVVLAVSLGLIFTPSRWLTDTRGVLLLWWVAILMGITFALFAVTDFRRPFVAVGRESGVARIRAVGIGDYVWLPARVVAWVVAAFALLVAGFVLTQWARGVMALSAPVISVVANAVVVVIGIGVAEWAGRRISGRPEPALDKADLYCQDVLRAQSIQPLYQGTGLWGAQLGSAAAASGTLGSTWLSGGLVLAGMALALASLLQLRPPTTHLRRRLWPDLAPGQVIVSDDWAGAA